MYRARRRKKRRGRNGTLSFDLTRAHDSPSTSRQEPVRWRETEEGRRWILTREEAKAEGDGADRLWIFFSSEGYRQQLGVGHGAASEERTGERSASAPSSPEEESIDGMMSMRFWRDFSFTSNKRELERLPKSPRRRGGLEIWISPTSMIEEAREKGKMSGRVLGIVRVGKHARRLLL
jgi:hypothetical protein